MPTAADEGFTIRVVVTAANMDQTIQQASAPTGVVQNDVPINQTQPTITGPAQRGQTLTGRTSGTWGGSGDVISPQWQRSLDNGQTWTNISGATSLTYALGVGDENSELRLNVSATNPDGSAVSNSAPTAVVPFAPPVATTPPAITGTAQRGQVLQAGQGTWSGVANTYAYRWQSSSNGTAWTDIAGANTNSYTVQTTDEALAAARRRHRHERGRPRGRGRRQHRRRPRPSAPRRWRARPPRSPAAPSAGRR